MVPPVGAEKSAGFKYDEELKVDGEEMPEITLRSIVEEEIRSSVGFIGGDISEQRRRAMDYYLGDPFGNEQEDRSQFVSTDVQDTIESIMPEMMEIFAGGDNIVRYEPTGPEDEEFSKQATDYANYIWQTDNDGFEITHDWVKDGLLQKNGLIKIYWEDSVESKRETIERINSLALQELLEDEEVEIVAHEEYILEDENLLPFAPDGVLHDVELIRHRKDGRVRIEPVPPEEFLIARRSVSLNRDAPFTCHKTRKTASDLLRMGYPIELINEIPSHDDQDYNEERISRFDDDEWPELDDSLDPAMREIWLYECYLKVDFDGDGLAEMRMVTVAGPGYKVLENEAVDDHPFASLTPIKMPHKFFGRSVADLTMDIQLIKSTIQRQLLDNMYLINNGRTAISTKVDIDDYLTNRPGGAIRVDTDMPDVQGHIAPVTTQSLGSYAFPLLEYFDTIREMRTGVTRLGQGLDPNALDTTASGMNMLLGRTQRRMLLMARTMSELGFKPAFKKILKLIVNRQDRPRMIRLRNEWIDMDPRSWNAEMDVNVSVGLGYGTKESQAMMFERVLEKQIMAIQMQKGLEGPFVDGERLHNTLEKWLHAMGIKDAESHFMDPTGRETEQPEEPPDPKLIEIQAKQQAEAQKLQIEGQKLRLESQKLEGEQAQAAEEMRLKWAEMELSHGVDVEKVGIEREKTAAAAIKLDQDALAKAGEMEIKRGELRVKEAPVESQKETAQAAAKAFGDVAKRMDDIEKKSKAPKKVRVRRGKDGKIEGAEIEQGGNITTMELKQ